MSPPSSPSPKNNIILMMSTAPLNEEGLPSPPFVTVPGIPNFRDLGGYKISSSPEYFVRTGIIYRSAAPQKVTKDGIATLNSLGITHTYDLRSKNEIERVEAAGKRGIIEWEGCERVFSPIFPDRDYSPEKLALRYQHYSAEGTEGFAQAYTDILDAAAPTSYRKILLHLANDPTKPLIIHCTAGKDRTGVICALILSLCGVDDESVAREYSLTELGLTDAWKSEAIARLIAMPGLEGNRAGALNMISAKTENMIATLKMIQEKFGGAERYVKEKCGLTEEEVEKIRSHLIVKEGSLDQRHQ